MKKLILTVLLAAVATLAPAASVFGGTVTIDMGALVGEQWHAVVKNQNGTGGGCDPVTGVCSVHGNWVTISTEGAKFDVATEWPWPNKATVTKLGEVILWKGQPFTYPTDPGFLRQYIKPGAKLGTSDIGNAVMSKVVPARQPVVSCTEHDLRGSLTRHPRINLAKHWWGYSGCDDPRLAPNVRAWLRNLDGKPLPGTLRLNIGVQAAPDDRYPEDFIGPRPLIWNVRYWNYNFDVDLSITPPAPQCPQGTAWDETLQACEPTMAPPPQCPPGTQNDWPNCTPICPPDYVWDRDERICVPKPPRCDTCGDIDPEGRVRLIDPGLKFRE